MNRIDEKFKELKKKNKKAFITYITAGDPDIKTTERIVYALDAAGADIIELGIPFSDPLADGPTIQQAVKRALDAGLKVKDVLKVVKKIRAKVQVPLVFMTYYNIVFSYGVKKFIKDSKAAGADGIIIPDLPMEESQEILKIAKKEEFDLIMLTAPTTPPARFKRIASQSEGFIYYVSLTGVTGARKTLTHHLSQTVKKLKKLTRKPVCVGFGVSSAKQAQEVAKASDGVIVGSAIIKIIEKNLKNKERMIAEIGKFAKAIARAVHKV